VALLSIAFNVLTPRSVAADFETQHRSRPITVTVMPITAVLPQRFLKNFHLPAVITAVTATLPR